MALATLEDLKARLEWELDADETRAAHGALDDLSDQALHYGRSTWTAATVPTLVRNTILAATTRYLRNPDGYTQSRAGDETLTWSDRGHDAGTPYFTEREVKLISGFAGRAGIGSIPVTAWGSGKRTTLGYVPVRGGGDPFPMFADEVEPW
jgi:hypothetical protein